jgi:hypothetical protein
MPHEPLLRRAAMPAPTRVLGIQLKTYSIGHELLIQSEDLFPNKMAALVGAVWICSNSWEENKRMPRDWLMGLKVKLLKRKVRKYDYETELAKLAAYRSEGSVAFPLSEFDSRSGRTPGAPLILQLQQFLMLKFGLSESAAWDYPFGLATQRWCSYYEREGGLKIKEQSEIDFMDFVAEQERRKRDA